MIAIPAGAVGIYARSNDNPLEYRNTTVGNNIFDISIVDDTMAIATPRNIVTHNYNNYLGGILSQDRTEVVWENNTRPLP